MDNLKTNKILAAFLLAGLLAMGGGKIAEILVPHEELAENAYPIEVKQVSTEGNSAAPTAQGPEPILALLSSADIQAGKKLAKKCTACHSLKSGGANGVGPTLWNIVNAPKANIDGYSYSKTLSSMGGNWTIQDLNLWLKSPKKYAPGNKMSFAGLRKTKDRANMIAFLNSISDEPIPNNGLN